MKIIIINQTKILKIYIFEEHKEKISLFGEDMKYYPYFLSQKCLTEHHVRPKADTATVGGFTGTIATIV